MGTSATSDLGIKYFLKYIFCYVALVGLKFTIVPRLALNSW